jgi:hypothetical protein
MKVARSALHISLSLRERVGVRETIMAHATYIFRGGAGAMIVRTSYLRGNRKRCTAQSIMKAGALRVMNVRTDATGLAK